MILSKLDAILDRKLSPEWHNWEVETLSMELGAVLDDYTLVKVMILKSLQEHPDIILHDADYLLRFIEIANGNVPDPHHHDIPGSLELIFAIKELQTILGESNVPVNNCLATVTRYVVNNEGHGEAYHPILSKYSGYPLVTNEKTKAGDEYIKAMTNGEK